LARAFLLFRAAFQRRRGLLEVQGAAFALIVVESMTKLVPTCANEIALSAFETGMERLYGFNHEEAVRCFRRCLGADPGCAMAHWGISYCMGPNYNNPNGLDPALAKSEAELAHRALPAPMEPEPAPAAACDSMTQSPLEPGASNQAPLERDLVEALLRRHGDAGGKPFDGPAFASAMAEVHQRHPENLDVAGLCAAARMDLRPWSLWTPATSPGGGGIEPEEGTLEIVDLLEGALAKDPRHPFLTHLYIHVMELSPTPEKAMPAADALRDLALEQGHLLHMPAHIYMWAGRYQDALDANVLAVAADERYVGVSGEDNEFYKFYRMHNYQFAIWAAMFEGQRGKAMSLARAMQARLGEEAVALKLGDLPFGTHFLEAFAAVPWHVMIRFGMWREILEEPTCEGGQRALFATSAATQHYARGIACAALGDVAGAERERSQFHDACNAPELTGRMMHNNLVIAADGSPSVLGVGKAMLDGEIEYRKGNFDAAFAQLREAVRREEGLVYDEPWGWMQPSRHALGALLLEQGHVEEAVEVFAADLLVWKDNMWSLLGLQKCLQRLPQPDQRELEAVSERLARASARADVDLSQPCFCAGMADLQQARVGQCCMKVNAAGKEQAGSSAS